MVTVTSFVLALCAASCSTHDGAIKQEGTSVEAAKSIHSPSQSESGPGGKVYSHEGVEVTKHGTASRACYIFTPKDPVPESAPVVVFLHGWSAIDPGPYQAWIDHIVRRGNIVIYPVYQNLIFNLGITVAKTAMRSTKSTLEIIEEGPVKPELNNFAVVGHSMGGAVALNMAVQGKDYGLPEPKALMIMQPGALRWYAMAEPEELSPDTRLIVLVGDRDKIAGDRMAKEIFGRVGQIPDENKAYVILQSDDHGNPPLIADHFSVCAPNLPPGKTHQRFLFSYYFTVDALDYYGYWKLFDALTDCAFRGENCAYSTTGASEHHAMGKWSDGTPVKRILHRQP